ncbi:F-box protein CPR1-like [Rutidosis leptorrhynchoides]|uniref:F-box protein CPR1-like n=1 Tax=Rutidosis leptorrhynchoides TaxID=125765 RepID=UPI003A994A4D
MDVIEEILERLDPEDLLRCKSVCKSWYNLISSDSFVKAHLKRSYISNREHRFFRIHIDWNSSYITENNNKLWRNFMMVGSCDGLVCISRFEEELLVANPSTREVIKLPKVPYSNWRCWGFGYDSLTDDFKVVVGFNESKHHMRFQLLSLKSNQWKFAGEGDCLSYRTCSFYPYRPYPYPGVLYDGALHWFMYDTKKKKKKKKKKKIVILSFDISLEEFKEIPQPDDDSYSCDDRTRLEIFDECLCIYNSYDIHTNHRQIWVMKNYNCWQLIPSDYAREKFDDITGLALHINRDNTLHLYVDPRYGKFSFHIVFPIFVKSLVSPKIKKKYQYE